MNIKKIVDIIIKTNDGYPAKTFNEKRKAYTCLNPYGYHFLRENHTLFEQMDGLFVDGMIMAKLVSWYNGHSIRRLSFDMTGMAVDLFERLSNNDETIYFIGAKQEEVEKAVNVIMKSYPNIHILGFKNGYFENEEAKKKACEEIISLNPNFVIIGMGTPRQEEFSLKLKNAGYKGISFTCGGFLHQTTNKMDYYPKWVNKMNLRAFYRLTHEKNMVQRLIYVLFHFPIVFTWDTIVTKLSK